MEHSASRDGSTDWPNSENILQSLNVIDFLSSRYALSQRLILKYYQGIAGLIFNSLMQIDAKHKNAKFDVLYLPVPTLFAKMNQKLYRRFHSKLYLGGSHSWLVRLLVSESFLIGNYSSHHFRFLKYEDSDATYLIFFI